MSRLRWGLVGLLLAVLLVVIVQNTDVVTLHFLVWDLEMSQVIFLLLTLAAGLLAGFTVGRWFRRRSRARTRTTR